MVLVLKGIAPLSQCLATAAAPHRGRTMLVLKKEFMYVSKAFGGEGGRLQHTHYLF